MRLHRLVLLLLVALALLLAGGASHGQAQPLEGSISGTVTAEADGPLSGIDVCAYESPGWDLPIGCDTSGASGAYTVAGLPAGDYVVLFQDPSGTYAFEWYNDKLNASSADLVSVTGGANTLGIDAALGPGGSISGTVTNEGDDPLPGIDVCPGWLGGWGRWDFRFACTVTDGSGTYTLGGLPALDYNVEFRDPSGTYATEWYNDKPDAPSADLVSVTAGANTPGIDAVLGLGGSISGTVTDEASGELSGIDVCAHHERLVRGAPWVFGIECASTDGAGVYSVRGLGTANYNVDFRDSSGTYGFEWYNDKDSIHTADLVSVIGGADTTGIDAALPLAGSISGTVTDESTGDPLPGIGVYRYGPGPPWHFWPPGFTTDDAGTYSVGSLRPGDYIVSFGYSSDTYIGEYYSDRWHSSTADPVSVTGGLDTGGINGTLIPDVPGLLKIGTLFAFTGGLAEFGPQLMRGAELAAKHLNEGGGVNGLPAVLIAEDSQTDPTQAVNAAQRLIDNYGVQAIVGALASGVTTPVAEQVTIPGQVLLVSPSSTSPAITDLVDDDLVFRTVISDALQGATLAQVAWDLGFRTACTMYTNNAYGQGLSEQFATTFEELGGTVTAQVSHATEEQVTYMSELSQCVEGNPDVLAAISYPEHGGVYLKEALDYALIDEFIFADGLKSESMFRDLGLANFEGMYGTAPGTTSTPEFSSAYEAEYGEPPPAPFIAEAYDAVVAIALAAERAGSTDSIAIRDALRSVACPPGSSVGAGATAIDQGLQLAAAGDHIDYEGGTGSLEFTEYGDSTRGMVEVWRIQNDEDNPIVTDREEPVAAQPDADGDGFDVCVEVYVGTDFLDDCPDDPTDDAWPFDNNVDTWSNVLDVLQYKGHLQTQVGDPGYDPRLDLNADLWVNVLDILLYKGHLQIQCTNP